MLTCPRHTLCHHLEHVKGEGDKGGWREGVGWIGCRARCGRRGKCNVSKLEAHHSSLVDKLKVNRGPSEITTDLKACCNSLPTDNMCLLSGVKATSRTFPFIFRSATHCLVCVETMLASHKTAAPLDTPSGNCQASTSAYPSATECPFKVTG